MKNKPIGILIICLFYLFNALLLVISIFFKGHVTSLYYDNIILGLPYIDIMYVKLILFMFSMILIIGILNFERWAYLTILVYNAYFLIINLYMHLDINTFPFIQNVIISSLIIAYVLSKRDLFMIKKYFKRTS